MPHYINGREVTMIDADALICGNFVIPSTHKTFYALDVASINDYLRRTERYDYKLIHNLAMLDIPSCRLSYRRLPEAQPASGRRSISCSPINISHILKRALSGIRFQLVTLSPNASEEHRFILFQSSCFINHRSGKSAYVTGYVSYNPDDRGRVHTYTDDRITNCN